MRYIDDDMANVSGTNGVTGAADAVIVLGKEKRTDQDAKMFITGRKVRQSMHNIKFNDKSCCWEYVGVAEITDKDTREQEERLNMYSNSDIRKAVLLVARNIKDEPWKGRAGDLIEAALQYGLGLRESNKEIGGFLNKMQGLFMSYDEVFVEKVKNGTGPWIYKIYPQGEIEKPFV